jgi:hypothetical protein
VKKPSVAIVSTSINERPEAYHAWAQQGDLIVAGDYNSPPELRAYVTDLGGTYLEPADQDHWLFSETVGWGCVQRRNAAVMVAYANQYDYVATVDDDNLPPDGWVDAHVKILCSKFPESTYLVHGDDGWVDTGQFNVPPVRQRGTPFGAVLDHTVYQNHTALPRCVVSAAQVLGDPDCDAVTRLVRQPKITSVKHNVVVYPDQYAAFNSQATLWDGEWAPLIACLPYVGRYDDIFASFIAKRIMMLHGVTVFAGLPCVTQDRNDHDTLEDLRNELYGMNITGRFVTTLRQWFGIEGDSLVDSYGRIVNALEPLLHEHTVRFMREWAEEWSRHMHGRK